MKYPIISRFVDAADGISNPVLTTRVLVSASESIIRLSGYNEKSSVSVSMEFSSALLQSADVSEEAVFRAALHSVHSQMINLHLPSASFSHLSVPGVQGDDRITKKDIHRYCKDWNEHNEHVKLAADFPVYTLRCSSILGPAAYMSLTLGGIQEPTADTLTAGVSRLLKIVQTEVERASAQAVEDSVKTFTQRYEWSSKPDGWSPKPDGSEGVYQIQTHVHHSYVGTSNLVKTTFTKKPASVSKQFHLSPVVRELSEHFDLDQRLLCPCGSCRDQRAWASVPNERTLSIVIQHLNDNLRMTREQIADWLEAQDLDLRHKGAATS